jgi:glycosyltransferase involved in cell wall biosynthesis
LAFKKKLRIAFFIDSLANLGGYQVFTNNLMVRLLARGHEVEAFVYASKHRRNRAFHDSTPFPINPAYFCSTPIIRYLSCLPATMLRLAQARHRFDIWQVIGVYPEAYLARYLVGQVPVAVRCYGQDIQVDPSLEYGNRLNPRVDSRVRRWLPTLDRFVAMGPSLADEYRALGIPESKIRVIPNGVEKCPSEGHLFDTAPLRHELGIHPDSFILLTVGRNQAKKNFGIIPDIAVHLQQANLDFTWIMVGPGTENLLPQIQRLNLESRFRLLGSLPPEYNRNTENKAEFRNAKLESIYRLANLFIFPAKLEGFNRTLIEAMAASLPLITTTAPGCRDIVTDFYNGFICKPDECKCFAEKIIILARDNKMYQQLAQNCLRETQRYDWGIITSLYEEMYYEMHENS